MVRLKNRYLLVHVLNPTPILPTASSYPDTPSRTPSKTLPPTVQFHPPLPPNITASVLAHAVKAQLANLYGDYGMGVTAQSFSIRYLSPATATFILRVSRAHYRLVWAALSFMTSLPTAGGTASPCVMRVVRVSGTIRKAEEEAMRRARESMRRARGAEGDCKVLGLVGDVGGDKGDDLEKRGDVEMGGLVEDDDDGEDGASDEDDLDNF